MRRIAFLRYLLPALAAVVCAAAGFDPSHPVRTPYAQQAPLLIRHVALSAHAVPVYGKLEVTVDATGTWDNPFESQDVALDASFRSPTGRVDTVPGFFYRPFRRSRGPRGEEIVSPTGPPSWRLRYSPSEPGVHTFSIRFRDRTGSAGLANQKFTATPTRDPGFVRVSERDQHYFEFENGRPYYPLGANVCWGGNGGTFQYDGWFADYARAGCNYARLWLSPQWTTFALERTGKPGEGLGIGQFDLGNAWRLDYVLDLAAGKGLYLMLCIDSYNILRDRVSYPQWELTPHNAANGGPLQRPEEFWTSPVMDRLYRNKLRYLVARYGYSTHVLSWEFWNEVDGTANYRSEPVRDWHKRMAEALRRMDPYAHPITTSFARTEGDRAVDTLPELDYVQTHHYGSPDLAATLAGVEATKRAYGKPHYVGEVGADASGPRKEDDPTGLQIHAPLWVSVAQGASGAAAPWWWDNYIAPGHLYAPFAAVSRFLRGLDWPEEGFHPAVPRLEWVTRPAQLPRADLLLENGPVSWDETPYNRPRTVRVTRTGAQGDLPLAGIQHGTRNHPSEHNPVTFQVDLPWPARFDVQVGDVSGYGGAALTITLDGKPALTRDFTDGRAGNETRHQFAGDYAVSVPAGKHTLVVENTGADWFLASYRFRKAVERHAPPVLAWATVGRRTALAWARVEGRSWRAVCQRKEAVPPAPPSVLVLPGVTPGRWEAEIWNTSTGTVTRKADLRVGRDRTARVTLGAVATDVGVKLRRRSERHESEPARSRRGPRRPERHPHDDDDD